MTATAGRDALERLQGQVLPTAPSDAEKTRYADRNTALILRTSLASFGALLISQIHFIASVPALLVFAPFIAFTLAYYLISLCVNVGTRGFDETAHRALVESWQPSQYPSLDVFLPVCGEPIEVLRNTWEHVVELLRAYPGVGTAYVLDDGDGAGAR
jgi:cellulose synthase (UDP-forming)